MSDEDLIKKITQQVLSKMKIKESNISFNENKSHTNYFTQSNENKNSNCTAIIVLTGSNKDMDSVFKQIESIVNSHKKCTIIMSSSAEKIIGIHNVRIHAKGSQIIAADYYEDIQNLVKSADIIYIPVLTLNTASKISYLQSDNLASIIVVYGLLLNKSIFASNHTLLPMDISIESLCPPVSEQINQIMTRLADLGICLTPLSDLTSCTSEQIIPSSGSICSLSATDCTACGLCVEKNMSGVRNIIASGADRISARTGLQNVSSDMGKYIDHTLLKPEATPEQIKKLCEEAKKYHFASVCVNPTNVALAYKYLKDSDVKVCTVIGFPLGATTSTAKAIETTDAIANGAQEIDMVINVGALKSGNDDLVRKDIAAVVDAAKDRAIVKVILETALLSNEEVVKGCLLSKMAGADFVKTSTGFGPGGATAEAIALMRKTVGPDMGVKASGGIRDYETAKKMIDAGATRIGASASVSIAKGKSAGPGKY